jgi:hypothetical protein
MDVTDILLIMGGGTAALALLGGAKLALQAGINLWKRMTGAV